MRDTSKVFISFSLKSGSEKLQQKRVNGTVSFEVTPCHWGMPAILVCSLKENTHPCCLCAFFFFKARTNNVPYKSAYSTSKFYEI